MTEFLTRKVAGTLDECSPEDVSFELHDLQKEDPAAITLDDETIAVVCMPVYVGKIPLPAARALSRLRGSGAMALAAVSYGGRSYGNALYELQHCAEECGLIVIGAGAFTIFYGAVRGSQRSAVPAVDKPALAEFCDAASSKIRRLAGCEIEGLRIKPLPVEVNGRMPVHKISRFAPGAAALAQDIFELLSIRRRHSEWFL